MSAVKSRDIIFGGRAAITRWRAEHPGEILDCSNCDFSSPSQTTESSDFSNINFSGSNFSSVRLAEANFTASDLSGAKFQEATLSRAILKNANLNVNNFIGANLSEADFTGAKLLHTDLAHANLNGLKLDGTNLQQAIFAGSVFRNMELAGRDFSGCNMEGANLDSCNIENAHFSIYSKHRCIPLLPQAQSSTGQGLTKRRCESRQARSGAKPEAGMTGQELVSPRLARDARRRCFRMTCRK